MFEGLNSAPKKKIEIPQGAISIDDLGSAEEVFGVNLDSAQELIENEGVVSGETLTRVKVMIAELQQEQLVHQDIPELNAAVRELINLRVRSEKALQKEHGFEIDHAERLKKELEGAMNPHLNLQ